MSDLIVDPSAQEPISHGRRFIIPLDEEEVRAVFDYHGRKEVGHDAEAIIARRAQLAHLLSTAAAKEEPTK